LTHEEYDELAALWGGAAQPEEQRELKQMALRTPRLARMVQWGELGVVAMLAATITASILWKLGLATLLIGSLILLLLGWSAWKRHHYGNAAMMLEEGDRRSFLRSLVRAREAELKRSAIGLAFILPGTLLTMLLGFSLRMGQGDQGLFPFLLAVLSTPRGVVALAFLACAVMLLSLSHLRLVAELKRLRGLLGDYEEEAHRDEFSGH
jgi:hypothetical protein